MPVCSTTALLAEPTASCSNSATQTRLQAAYARAQIATAKHGASPKAHIDLKFHCKLIQALALALAVSDSRSRLILGHCEACACTL